MASCRWYPRSKDHGSVSLLADSPTIVETVAGAGFNMTDQLDLQRTEHGVQLDLLAFEDVCRPGRRGQDLTTVTIVR